MIWWAMAKWQLPNPIMLGHDFGGATVLRTHLLHHCSYQRMILLDAVSLAPWGSPFVLNHNAAFDGLPDYLHQALVKAYVQDAAHNTLPDEVLQAYVAPWLGEIGQPAFYRQIAQMDLKYTNANYTN